MNAIKNFLYRGRMVAVDTRFSISATSVEYLVKSKGVNSWGWKLRDGVVVFYIPEIEVDFIRSLFLNRNIYCVVI